MSADGVWRSTSHGKRQFEGTYVNVHDAVFLANSTCKLLMRKDSGGTRAELVCQTHGAASAAEHGR